MIDWLTAWLATYDITFADSALWLLFASGFLSATILPGSSEASLLATLAIDEYAALDIILVAAVGNTLGGATNYLIGLWLPNRTNNQSRGQKAIAWLSQYGYFVLLLSWLPVIGDVLCLAAGWLRMRFLPSVLLIFIGKTIRYMVLTALFLGLY